MYAGGGGDEAGAHMPTELQTSLPVLQQLPLPQGNLVGPPARSAQAKPEAALACGVTDENHLAESHLVVESR